MITYLYYRLCEYFITKDTDLSWQRGRALIATSGLIVVNMLTILLFINSIFYKGENLLNTILSGSHVIDKFIILPIVVSPVFILVYFLGRKRLEPKIDIYKNESKNIRKRNGFLIIMYIVLSYIVLGLSIASPVYIK